MKHSDCYKRKHVTQLPSSSYLMQIVITDDHESYFSPFLGAIHEMCCFLFLCNSLICPNNLVFLHLLSVIDKLYNCCYIMTNWKNCFSPYCKLQWCCTHGKVNLCHDIHLFLMFNSCVFNCKFMVFSDCTKQTLLPFILVEW